MAAAVSDVATSSLLEVEDLCAGYGYPQLTDQAKRKILGENLLRLHGMDLAEARARLRTSP